MSGFPATPLLDALTGANVNPLPAPWQGPTEATRGQMFITSAKAAAQGSFSACSNRSDVAAANLEAWVTVDTLPTAGNAAFLDARIQNPGNATTATLYRWTYIPGTGFGWYKMTGGHAFTPIGLPFATHTLAAGEQLGISVSGTTISGYYGVASLFTSVDSRTDSSITGSGTIGFGGDDTTVRFTGFGGGAIGSSPRIVINREAQRRSSRW